MAVEAMSVMDYRVGELPQEPRLPGLEKHTAESKWQFCMCGSCREKRRLLDMLPGKAIDYSTFRHKDEKY
jgi:hypothetical protein